MKAIVVALLAFTPWALGTGDCSDNNGCARAVTGTRRNNIPIETKKADCSSYMTDTVWTTVTDTTTVYRGYTQFVKEKRYTHEGGHHSVPPYARGECGRNEYSSACSCLGITASTTTSTTTVTKTTRVAPTCHRGLQYAFYRSSEGYGYGQIPHRPGEVSYYAPKAEEMKSWTPTRTGVTYQLGDVYNAGNYANPVTVYGFTIDPPSDFIAFDHRGYLYAKKPGTYKYTIPAADDATFVFAGTKSASRVFGEGEITLEDTYTRGQYVPLRVTWLNSQGGAGFYMRITDPDGNIIMGKDSVANDYIIQYCDAGPAVPYAPWGQW